MIAERISASADSLMHCFSITPLVIVCNPFALNDPVLSKTQNQQKAARSLKDRKSFLCSCIQKVWKYSLISVEISPTSN